MALETGNYVYDLTITNPVNSDQKSQGAGHLRLLKTVQKNTFAGFTGAVLVTGPTTGSSSAYVVTPATALVSYLEGMGVLFKANHTNAAAVTINISGLGAKSIRYPDGTALAAGEILSGKYTTAIYDATNGYFVIVGGHGLTAGDHSVMVNTGNGWGSTNTKIRRWTTTQSSSGTAITYADSATLGGSFTINSPGLYAITAYDNTNDFGISLNSAQLTTAVTAITTADRLAYSNNNGLSILVRLAATNVIRAHFGSVVAGSDTTYGQYFAIRKVGV